MSESKKMNVDYISVKDLKSIVEKHGADNVIDIRESIELALEKFPGSQHIPLSSFEQNISQHKKNKEAYIFCRSGARAKTAAYKMANRGFKKVYIVDGGIEAWKRAGFKVEKGEGLFKMMPKRFIIGLLTLIALAAYFLRS
ncbi:rhodanese-like domain-containing protein [bacterium]|nr:rhodanese-like domain-containing protein [bacterium]